MLRISQMKIDYRHDTAALEAKLLRRLKIAPEALLKYEIVKRSVDARKKPNILFTYTIDVWLKDEQKWLKQHKDKDIAPYKRKNYQFKADGGKQLNKRPVIVGSGPAGLFCALMLSRHGYCPIVLERGSDVDERLKAVHQFWEDGTLDGQTNVQFGEGGAGTFSDGKLNTLIKDKTGRCRKVLEIFCEAGADKEILYVNKPHIGTDVLVDIVRNIRREIIKNGGEVLFNAQMTDLYTESGRITGIEINGSRVIHTELLVLAIGHSARDTFELLNKKALQMSPKAFAVGVRVEHPQQMINEAQYAMAKDDRLKAADYKLTYTTSKGRNVYTFCMCPGGYVVNASSEPGRIAVNGMSCHARDGVNANSAVIVNVTPEDCGGGPLDGIVFQQKLEAAAYAAAGCQMRIPVQLYKDFKAKRPSYAYGKIMPEHKGENAFADLNTCLPDFVCESIVEGMEAFGRKINGFNRPDTLLSGVESRTSSPVRIERSETFESNVSGIYPCGEGAGYAGGITSAAMDGLKVAEAIASKYKPLEER